MASLLPLQLVLLVAAIGVAIFLRAGVPAQAQGLEAVVRIEGRPALLVQEGRFATPPAQWQCLEETRTSIERSLRSVGRIDLSNFELAEFAGTAFLVAPDVVMTNRHVAAYFCRSGGAAAWQLTRRYDPCLDFRHEACSTATARFAVTALLGVIDEPGPDLALFRIERESPDAVGLPDPLPLARQAPADLVGRTVFTAGFPFSRNDEPEILRRIFGDDFGVKRLQPGKVTAVRAAEQQLWHDCSTLGGSSGSCVVDLETAQVVGLHYQGEARSHNRAVALWSLRDHALLRSAGVTFV